MRSARNILAVGVLATLWLVVGVTSAQQMTIGTPFHTLGDNFFERMGVNFAGNYRGINFSVGSYGQAVPTFGEPKLGSGLTTGFAIVGPKGQLNFAVDLSQGYTQSAVTQAPTVTIMNGQQGYVSDTSQTPFVISVVPVVGAFQPVQAFSPCPTPQQLADAAGMPLGGNPRIQAMRDAIAAAHADDQPGSPVRQGGQPGPVTPRPRRAPPEPAAPEDEGPAGRLAAAQESTAGRPAPSVAEARRMRAQEEGTGQEEVKALFERGLAAEEAGKPGVAKVYYQQVARRASGELKDRALARLDELRGTAPSH